MDFERPTQANRISYDCGADKTGPVWGNRNRTMDTGRGGQVSPALKKRSLPYYVTWQKKLLITTLISALRPTCLDWPSGFSAHLKHLKPYHVSYHLGHHPSRDPTSIMVQYAHGQLGTQVTRDPGVAELRQSTWLGNGTAQGAVIRPGACKTSQEAVKLCRKSWRRNWFLTDYILFIQLIEHMQALRLLTPAKSPGRSTCSGYSKWIISCSLPAVFKGPWVRGPDCWWKRWQEAGGLP